MLRKTLSIMVATGLLISNTVITEVYAAENNFGYSEYINQSQKKEMLSEVDFELNLADDDVITISTVDDLELIRNNPSASFSLLNDIDLNGAEWEPIEIFSGKFSGNGYSIKNFTISNNISQYLGFFNQLDNAEISDLTLEQLSIAATDDPEFLEPFNNKNIGGLCGYAQLSKINNCTISGNINADIMVTADEEACCYVGGVAGYSYSTITNSKMNGNLNVKSNCKLNVGGITGCNEQEIIGSSAEVAVDCESSDSVNYGGIAGFSSFSITDCNTLVSQNIALKGKTCTVGGISAGSSGNKISNCSVEGNPKMNLSAEYNYVGGISGVSYDNSVIENCIVKQVSGNLTTDFLNQASTIGGIVGRNICALISNSNAELNVDNIEVKNSVYIGGIVGINESGSVEMCYAKGGIKANSTSITSSYIGGIVANNTFSKDVALQDALIKSSGADVDISAGGGGAVLVGGIVGYNQAFANVNDIKVGIESCYSNGDITLMQSQDNSFAGGGAGYIYDASLSNCYSTGKVKVVRGESDTNNVFIGVFAGRIKAHSSENIYTKISNCYTSGDIDVMEVNSQTNFHSGPFTSEVSADSESTVSIEGCKYFLELEVLDGLDGTECVTKKSEADYSNWDFKNKWRFSDDNMPKLVFEYSGIYSVEWEDDEHYKICISKPSQGMSLYTSTVINKETRILKEDITETNENFYIAKKNISKENINGIFLWNEDMSAVSKKYGI